ncbi:MAG: ankyrin repeat domain-containing protein [Micavibrio sp.]|nr:ankyrin repeat domain-containing protein [Micavibrio sp.]
MTAAVDILAQAAAGIFVHVGDFLALDGAQVNAADAQGWTLLHYVAAAEARGQDVDDSVHMLLQAGADIHVVNGQGDTPFNIAAPASPTCGRLMTEHWLGQALMGRGAKGVNDRSGSHQSTLAQYMAKWSRDEDIETQLTQAVAAGMKLDVRNGAGWTPVTAAAAMGRAAIVEAFVWHYDYAAIAARTVEEYVAQYGGCRVVYAAGLDAGGVAQARLTQDKNLTSVQKSDYAKTIAFILLKLSGG